MANTLPYISQNPNALLSTQSLTPEQLMKWEYNLCGLLCVLMVIKGLKDNSVSLQQILHTAESIQAYDENRGWVHKKLVELCTLYGVIAFSESQADVQKVEEYITNNHVVIASVSPRYLQQKKQFFFNKKCGHLILIVGIEQQKNKPFNFYIHDPGSRESGGGENVVIDSHSFEKNFSGNMIVIKKSNQYE